GANPQTVETCGTYNELGATANDPCFGDITGSIVIDASAVNTALVGSYSVTYNVMDADGNPAAQVTRTVDVVDTTIPTFNSCPPSVSVNNDAGICGAIVNYTVPTATDSCGTATVTQTDATGFTSGDIFPIGTTTIEYTATDGNGNNTVCSFNVTVTDNEVPTIICPTDITVNADANCEATTVTLGAPTTSDNCGVASVTNDLSLPLSVGIHTITWTVTDTAGLTATCTQQVTVEDVTPPVITCPTPNPFYNTDAGQCNATLTFNATATDNCSGSPIISYEIAGTPITFPYVFPVGTTTVDVIADDGNGLTSTCNFNVLVEDHEAPTAVCQTVPVTITLDATGNANIVASDIDGGSFDYCGTVTLNASQTAFTCADVGTNIVTLTVTDTAGNFSTCNAEVIVLDHVQGATATITSTPGSPICLGESVTFTATGTNLGANPSYQWYEGGTPVGTDSNTYATTGLTNGENVYVEITSGPCNTVTISNTIVMTVNPLLPVTYTLNTSANPACSGENVTFFVTGLINGGATPTYQWYEGATPVGTNTNSYTSSTITDGETVSVDVTSSLACANPIPATQSITMTVTPNATISLTSAAGTDNQEICNGSNITEIEYNLGYVTGAGATVTGLPVGFTTNYSGSSFTINAGSTVPVGTYNYTVTPIGCGNATATGTIIVNPDATITLISPDAYEGLCNGNPHSNSMTPIQFQLGPGATGAILNSTPALPAGIIGSYNAGTGVYTISGSTTQVGSYVYTVTTTGCGSGASIEGLIKVYNGPPVINGTINNTGGWPTNICDTPQTVTFSVPLDPNVESYNWTFSSTNFTIVSSNPNANSVEVFITEPNWSIGHWANVTAVNPCGTDSEYENVVNLNLNPIDIEVYTLDDNSGDTDIIYVCEGTTSYQMAGDVGGIDYSNWEWSDNGGIDGTPGSFSTITSPPTYICDFELFGICWSGHWESGVTTTTFNSIYTFPANAEGGDIITITLEANQTLCAPATDNLEIHILEATDAEITSTDTTICEGESTTITFEGAPDSQIRVYDGSGNVWYNVQPDGTFPLTVSPTVTTTYTLNRGRYHPNTYPGSNNNNCPTVLNESVTITVNEPPTVTAPADITICEGDTVSLASATINGTNAVGSWTTSGNGTFAGNIYTPHAADVFNSPITLTYTNTPSDGICSPVSDTMLVTINQAPTIYAGVDQTICSSDSIAMTASFGGSATSGTWSGGTGTFSSNAPNATYTPGVGETGTIILTYTSNDADGAGPCGIATDTVEITINQGATVNAGADQTICSSDTVSLSASFGGSATSATWSTSGSGTFSGSTYTPSTADITNGFVTLTYTTNNPPGICGIVSDSILITINEAATVNAGLDSTICSSPSSNTIALNASTNTTGSWSGGTGTFSDPSSPTATYTLGVGETSGTLSLTYTTIDPDGAIGPCSAASDTVIYTITPFINAVASNLTTITNCSNTNIQLNANGSGFWSATPVTPGSTFVFSNVNDPNAMFTGESGAEYNITWTLNNVSPCGIDTDMLNIVFPNCTDQIDFDGTDDNISFNNAYNLSGSFSIEAWIKPNEINANIQTILSKRNANNLATGYDLRLVGNTISFHANGSNISATGITDSRWYHIAVTYNGTQYKLYVDGIDMNTRTGPSPTTNTFTTLLGAMSRVNNTPTNYFKGWMDEVRIWNRALTATQIREMMNQEIQPNGALVQGSVIPVNISGPLNWNTDLIGYYKMNQGSDISGGNLVANVGVSGLLRNITTLQSESAPLPYISNAAGNWTAASTWLNGSVQQIPNTNGLNGNPVTWNIVRTQHNISSTNKNITVLGLIVDENTLTIENSNPVEGQSIRVTNYLRIGDLNNGNNPAVLDLEGESQLLQNTNSIVDYTADGALHKDQQGTTNLFNYNYWSSPVSTDGNTYQIGSILHDGANPVGWTTANDATGSTNPVTLSSRWLYLYENYPVGNYADWHRINQTYNVPVGLGYTMKGSGVGDPINDVQNYTFVGKPNNGIITSPVTGGNEALVGNPYPSALNANLFIADNAGSITGPLYFWEHSRTNASHVTIDYEGGYAAYSLSGGVAATTPPTGLGGIGSVGKIPRQFVPVGQGFYVTGDSDGGTITFNNNQREFRKETTPNTSVFIRNSNQERTELEDLTKRVRLNFTSPEGAIRPLLLAFTPNNEATEGVDYGYDAKNSDYFPSDMSFVIDNENYVIQGVGEFQIDNMYPISIELGTSGTIEIELTDLENFDEEIDVFVYDALLGTYSRINTVNYQIALDAGSHADRYFIAFKNEATLNTVDEEFSNVIVNYLNASNEIYINVPNALEIKQVYLINMLGQTVKSWNKTNAPLSHECKIPVRKISEGTYIIKVRTSDNKLINKKIVVKQN
ncbi:HYR domain-containing protein, partial [Xanthomarina sp. GH4-25]|uniref:HYR domain-containing protein n=1 Tax=Xanthomarina sp. GH4-25 TaxID=3349335 RepID=UPI003877EC69